MFSAQVRSCFEFVLLGNFPFRGNYCTNPLYLKICLGFFQLKFTFSSKVLYKYYYTPVLKIWNSCACATCDYSLIHNIHIFPDMAQVEKLLLRITFNKWGLKRTSWVLSYDLSWKCFWCARPNLKCQPPHKQLSGSFDVIS